MEALTGGPWGPGWGWRWPLEVLQEFLEESVRWSELDTCLEW